MSLSNKSLNQDQFDRLLHWLSEDREAAGLAYEKIRRRLTTIFIARGCREPEELTDETIDRVSRRVADICETYQGEKVLYFLGVANNVHHEYLRRPSTAELVVANAGEDQEQVFNCLEQCISKLTERSQHLIREYYRGEKQEKIKLRKALATRMGINLNALRARTLRIREELQTCIESCLTTGPVQ
jgi:DNA-directed RNA polymerase specialized sigma24 family protein